MAPAASADEVKMYHRMADWYNRPECDALRATWGAYPATPGALQAWPGFVAVTNAFLDSDAADDRPAVAAAAEPVATEAESEPVGVSEVVPEVVEGEEGVVTEPVVASEAMERDAPAEGAAEKPQGWLSSLLGPRHESGAEADGAASKPEIEQAASEAVGSVEFVGMWKRENKERSRLMPVKMSFSFCVNHEPKIRLALGKLVDELVRNKVSSGILVISQWTESGEGDSWPVWGISWSARPDDERYQQLGLISREVPRCDDRWRRVAFAGFDGFICRPGDELEAKNAVYRVTLPRESFDPWKWVSRPPPPAPEDLYTGPRDDGLLSTDEISGEYYSGEWTRGCTCCRSMTVIPHGPDTIETQISGLCFFPPIAMGIPIGFGRVAKRDPGTNMFGSMAFSADGTVKDEGPNKLHNKKRPNSRAFGKVETRDLAGKWRGCVCIPVVVPVLGFTRCTTKTALNEDQYTESGCCFFLCFPLFPVSGTRTRKYVNGHPTNGFDDGSWYRDAGYARNEAGDGTLLLTKKIG